MKLSLSWIFDHIKGSWKDYDIAQIVEQFNKTTAELDGYEYITIDVNNLTFGQVIAIEAEKVVLTLPEFQKDVQLPLRKDVHLGDVLLLKKDQDAYAWATGSDLHGSHVGLLPQFFVTQKDLEGNWKDTFEVEDYIITLDNKSITHRPDLWGHRGFAREIAALLHVSLVPEEQLLASCPIKTFEHVAPATPHHPIGLEIKDPKICKRLAGIYCANVSAQPSLLQITSRLLRVESRPINAIVDATNYVMFDLGQPLHAFDVAQIPAKKIAVFRAQAGQKLTLLDGETISLLPDDIVITDGKQILGLAGIMGGASTGVTTQTKDILVESACFDASTIRKTSLRLKKRTEGSSRQEKSLDPQQNAKALLRFLFLLQKNNISFVYPKELMLLGHDVLPHKIEIKHAYIENKLGVSIDEEFVIKTLRALSFNVQVARDPEITYLIEVPTFRATKDITIPEDIVEEVGRFFGFEKIPHLLPALPLQPTDMTSVLRLRQIKNYMAYAAMAREVRNYALYDEEFLKRLRWNPEKTIFVQNPISDVASRLVTSLMPHLLKNVYNNNAHEHMLYFFEWNRVWHMSEHKKPVERKQLAAIFYHEKKPVNFYDKKQALDTLFVMLKLPITWHKVENTAPWYHPHQTAELQDNQRVIGYAGMLNPAFCSDVLLGQAFIFEIDGDWLITAESPQKKYVPIPKYQDTWFDVSMLIPASVSVEQLQKLIAQTDKRIFDVKLIDFFEKPEWRDQRSVTLRFYARDPHKTLTTSEIDVLYDRVLQNLKNVGAQIR